MLHASQSVEYVARVFFPGFFFLFLSWFFFFLYNFGRGEVCFYPRNFNPEFPFFVQSVFGGAENWIRCFLTSQLKEQG